MKRRILEGALAVFKKQGIKFTMDNLAEELGMSKKTIYTVFPDKGTLLCELVDYVFDEIKESEETILGKNDIPLQDRIRQMLGAMPESYTELDFTQLYMYKDKYPKAYARITEHLESGWEKTNELLDEGVRGGVIREDIDYSVFQMIYEAALERFLSAGELSKYGITYMEAMNQLVDIMMDGIAKTKE